ncbi:MAG: hypothetical protein NZ811_01995 [Gammaproteobacteria bacterium]|nr:hypothetical protein [Gammaproteobacteria bacterium]
MDDLILMSPNRKRITQLEAEREELIKKIKDLYEAESLLSYLTSDEYIDLINRREEDEN